MTEEQLARLAAVESAIAKLIKMIEDIMKSSIGKTKWKQLDNLRGGQIAEIETKIKNIQSEIDLLKIGS